MEAISSSESPSVKSKKLTDPDPDDAMISGRVLYASYAL